MADFQKIKAMDRKEREELFLSFETLFAAVNGRFGASEGEAHKAYSCVLDIISDVAIKRNLESQRVKIVRCKDCMFFVEGKEKYVSYCNRNPRLILSAADDFCSCGKRKAVTDDR